MLMNMNMNKSKYLKGVQFFFYMAVSHVEKYKLGFGKMFVMFVIKILQTLQYQ